MRTHAISSVLQPCHDRWGGGKADSGPSYRSGSRGLLAMVVLQASCGTVVRMTLAVTSPYGKCWLLPGGREHMGYL